MRRQTCPQEKVAAKEMSSAIETRRLTRTFKSKKSGRQSLVRALDNVDLKVAVGELFGLLGPNGAGKTTLIKILCTLLLPTSGRALVGGLDVVKDPARIREFISLASGGESPGYGILTVRENLWFFSQLHGVPGPVARDRIKELLGVVDLSDKADERMNRLSSGMKQKLNLARAFLSDPQIAFLDEPTLGLDVTAAYEIRKYIHRWVKREENKTVLLTTHYMVEADQLCDRVAIIDKGRIIACDTPKNLKKTVVHESSFEIEVKHLGGEAESLRRLKGVKAFSYTHDIEKGSTTLKLVVDDEAAISDVASGVFDLGSRIISLKKTEPTLETVFMSLVGRGLE